MNRVFVAITNDLSNVPNLEQLLQEEHAVGSKWKAEGILEHLFVKENAKGAVLVFKDVDVETIKLLIPKLPLSKHFKEVEYSVLDKQF
jgi:hypothetical protein